MTRTKKDMKQFKTKAVQIAIDLRDAEGKKLEAEIKTEQILIICYEATVKELVNPGNLMNLNLNRNRSRLNRNKTRTTRWKRTKPR